MGLGCTGLDRSSPGDGGGMRPTLFGPSASCSALEHSTGRHGSSSTGGLLGRAFALPSEGGYGVWLTKGYATLHGRGRGLFVHSMTVLTESFVATAADQACVMVG
jgi:hypothetical protein